MFEKVHFLFKNEKPLWDNPDIQHWVQNYLQEQTKSEQVICEAVSRGVVSVRVGAPTLQQEVLLLEYDLRKKLKAVAGFELKKVKVFL